MQGVPANSKRKREVVDQLINVALALEEVWVLVIDVPGLLSGCYCQLNPVHIPFTDKTARHQCLAGQLHDPHHSGCKGGTVRTFPSDARDKENDRLNLMAS